MTVDERMGPPSASGTEPVVLGGRYVLAERLGQGGMADVHRARDTVLNRQVAVKVFHRHVAIPDSALRRTGEVHLLAGLSHPHLVLLLDAARDDAGSYDYLVMELVAGTTLAARIPLPARDVARLGAQLADALAYVHELGIVHRDVKPANVLLDPDAVTAKLTDFGVARLVEATALTVQGTTLGTPNYLSPEQATGAPVTGASDVYSLGLVLFEALTGEKAYAGTGIEAAVARLHRDPHLPEWVDARWRQLIAAMTAREPAARPTAARVATLLGSWDDTADVTQLLPRADRPRRRRPAWLVAAGGGVLAAAAVAVALAVTGGSGAPATTVPTVPRSPAASSVTHGAASPSARPSARTSSHTAAPVVARSTAAVPRSRATTPAAVVQPPAATVHVPPGQAKKLGGPGPGKPAKPGKGPGKHKP